jgi:hypothetical protein
MGFLMGALGAGRGGGAAAGGGAGTGLSDPRHTLRRLFARDPAALEDVLATTAEGKARRPRRFSPPGRAGHGRPLAAPRCRARRAGPRGRPAPRG